MDISVRKLNSTKFQEILKSTGSYKTPQKGARRPWPSWLATIVFNICMLPIFIMGYIYAKRPNFMNTYWAEFCLKVYRLIERLGGRIEIEGFDKLNKIDRPVVFVCNHVSSLETYMLPAVLMTWPGLIIVLKESLAHYPLFGQVVRSVDPIRVERKNPLDDLRKVLNQGTEGIKNGRNALIFPQGARYRLFDPKTFNTLGVKLAKKADVDIVPLVISTDFLRIGKKHRDLGMTVHPKSVVRMACGDVVSKDLSPKEMNDKAIEFISSKLKEWEAESGLSLHV